MRELTFVEPGKLEWRERPSPKLHSGIDALVRPLAVTRCDLDLYIARGDNPLPGPFGFGHEIAAEVIECGDQVKGAAAGDRVIVPFQISCGACTMCQRGLTNACLEVPAYSAYGLAPSCGHDWGGGLADVVYVPYADGMLVPIPEGMSMATAAALSDNALDGYRTVAQPIRDWPEASVLVVGGLAQSVGLYAVQTAVALGAPAVVYTDSDPARLAAAAALGAQTLRIDYSERPKAVDQFPVVVDASANPDGLIFALRSTAACGKCIGVSAPFGSAPELPLRAMYMKGATYEVSRVQARGILEEVLGCIACGNYSPALVAPTTLPFDQAPDAMMDADIKIVFQQAPF